MRWFAIAALLVSLPADAAVFFDYVDLSPVSGFSGTTTHPVLGTVTVSGALNSGTVLPGAPGPSNLLPSNPTLLAEFGNSIVLGYGIAENVDTTLDATLTFSFENPLPANAVIFIGSIRGAGAPGAQITLSFVDQASVVRTDLSSWTAWGPAPSVWFDAFADPVTPPTS